MMMSDVHNWSNLDPAEQLMLLERPVLRPQNDLYERASQIISRVRRDGDDAIRKYSREFDRVDQQDTRVDEEEFERAERELTPAALRAIDAAISNVSAFHRRQTPQDIDVTTVPGVRCQRISQPIDAVGLYVPAGSAPLPSAAIMLAVPAAIAGCPVRVLCTPPRADGGAAPSVLVAARRCGIDTVFRIGGAQAIAAMAFGTASVPAVNKIFGPGNAWVTAAKTLVSGEAGACAIDMPAGPSELLVIADEAADAEFVAADLLSQAEHGEDSQVVLLATSEDLAGRITARLRDRLNRLARREIAGRSLQHSRMIIVGDVDTAIGISNRYAPEHLILHIRDPREKLERIRNAGSVFLGPWSPESAGDYCSGTNHVLPTHGAARSYSGLSVEQFMRHMTVQELTRQGLADLCPSIVELARLEGLDAHAEAVLARIGPRTPAGRHR